MIPEKLRQLKKGISLIGWSTEHTPETCYKLIDEIHADQQKLIEQLVGACDIASSRLPWDSSAKKMCDDALAAAKQQKGK